MWGGIYSAKAMTPMTVAMMMFTALSLIESASIPASFSLRTAEAIHKAAAVSVAPKALSSSTPSRSTAAPAPASTPSGRASRRRAAQ